MRLLFRAILAATVSCATPAYSQAPNTQFNQDPATAGVTKVVLRSLGPGLGLVAYSFNNFSWIADIRNVEYSLWAFSNGQLVRLDQRRAAFVAKGQYVAADNIRTPFLVGRMVVCASYEVQGRKVSIVDFYTNENASSFQRQIGEMSKFRESLTEVDGAQDLCRSMPEAAARAM